MKHKKLKYIEVHTHPNGYSLTTGDKEYMYLDLRQLIEGIFVHVGLGEGNYMTREKVADLLAVCEEWIGKRDQVFDHAKANAEIKRLNRLVKQKQNTIETLQLTLETMHDKLDAVPRSQARRKDAPASKNKNFTRADAGLPSVPKKKMT